MNTLQKENFELFKKALNYISNEHHLEFKESKSNERVYYAFLSVNRILLIIYTNHGFKWIVKDTQTKINLKAGNQIAHTDGDFSREMLVVLNLAYQS